MATASEPRNCFCIPRSIFTVLLAGVGFLADAYDLFVINIVVLILKQLSDSVSGEAAIATAALVGSILGQLSFGYIADRVGRKIGFVITLSLVVVGAILSSLSSSIGALSVFGTLAICRFILGVGIGGEYPLSATISAESAVTATRGRNTAAVFSMQGFGMLLAPVLGYVLVSTMGTDNLDLVWRLLLAFGAVPGLVMFYWRLTMHETKRFNSTHSHPVAKWPLIKQYWRTLLGTAGGWFLFDVTFYANGLFSSTIIEESGFVNQDQPIKDLLLQTTVLDMGLVAIAIPGYFTAVLLIDRWGRRRLQLIGFAAMAVLYIGMGVWMDALRSSKTLFIIVYGLTFFFSNAGPNTTTFVLPSESFPTAIRATCHGISAATGKLGAVVGGILLRPLQQAAGLEVVMIVCGCVALSGLALTWWLVEETMGRSLEAITHEAPAVDEGGNEIELTTAVQGGDDEVEEPLQRAYLLGAQDWRAMGRSSGSGAGLMTDQISLHGSDEEGIDDATRRYLDDENMDGDLGMGRDGTVRV